LRLAHAFGVYPVALRDAVISLGDDAFLFCVGRQIAIYNHVQDRLTFLTRDSKGRTVSAAARSANSRLLALAERFTGDNGEGYTLISVQSLPRLDATDTGGGFQEAYKSWHPQNRRLDIVGLAFASEKFLVSLSSRPDCTITYWKWEVEKAMASQDCKHTFPLTRLQVNPRNCNQLSVSGPQYMKIWEYHSNDGKLTEGVSMYPGPNMEKQLDIVDHCWVLGVFLCAVTCDGEVHFFEDGEYKDKINVRDVIAKDDEKGQKAEEREQARALQSMMGKEEAEEVAVPVTLYSIAPWGRGFVVGGDQGYLGIFKVDVRMQVEPFGTFRMPGEDSTIYFMSAGSADSKLSILSYKEVDDDDDVADTVVPMNRSSKGTTGLKTRARNGTGERFCSQANASAEDPGLVRKMHKMWSLSTFPVSQADLAITGKMETFQPVFPLGTHHGKIISMASGGNRRVISTIGSDMKMKLWGYPSDDGRDGSASFTSELNIQASIYEKPKALAMHPLGFHAAVIVEDTLRIYHLVTQQVTRTLYDLPLKRPGDCAFSNSGSMLAVTAEHDVILLDPWRATLIHVFSGRGGHLSAVSPVLFSEDDRLLLSCGAAPHGAIYGWDLESENKERTFEHVSKSTSYSCIAHDFRRSVVVALVQQDTNGKEGSFRVISNIDVLLEVQPEGRGERYTTLLLAVPLGLLFVGTNQGSVRLFPWPLVDGGVMANPLTECAIHAHSITSLVVSQDSRFLFSSCMGGAVMACKIEAAGVEQVSVSQLHQNFVRYRYNSEIGSSAIKKRNNREDERKTLDLQRKLTSARLGMSTNTATLDELVLVPKNYFGERLTQIKELEDNMERLERERDFALDQKDQETKEKLNNMMQERKRDKGISEEKYDKLFTQLKKANERHQESMAMTNKSFDEQTQKLQGDYDARISTEIEKQTRLLNRLEALKHQHATDMSSVEQNHKEKLGELRAMQEKAMQDWRNEYDRVCALLKSDGLKFEEALRQQESEYEDQITEILEHKRLALQTESEKFTVALKDGKDRQEAIHMLHRQLKMKDDEITKVKNELEEMQKRLEASQEMFAKLQVQLRERESGLKVKDKTLAKQREQIKHLESFRFVLCHKVRALEEERDPLEEQLKDLETSVQEMYSEFVREFRKKQKVDQKLECKESLATYLQKENVELRASLVQLKKDARRMIEEVETVLHAESTAEFEKMPKKLKEVVQKHMKLKAWAPPSDEDCSDEKTTEDIAKEASLVNELKLQRDLLFRKNQIATGQALQSKRECTTDFRRLTAENASLIVEMNTLRSENKSFQRSCKELEASVLAFREQKGGRGGGSSPSGGSVGLGRNASAPDFLGSDGGGGASVGAAAGARRPGGGPTSDTPYMRRKVVDQQELYRRQQQKQRNQLPPVSERSSTRSAVSIVAPARQKPSLEEKRFAQTLDSVDAGRRQMERQGFDMNRLTSQAQAMTGFYDRSEFEQNAPPVSASAAPADAS